MRLDPCEPPTHRDERNRPLRTRQLGISDLHITALGLGAWVIGGGGYAFGWGAQNDDDSLHTIRHAVDAGINWIDTAPGYGRGHSEEIVGKALRQLPESSRPLIFTKCGVVWDENDPGSDARKNLRPESIRKECEASLRRLGVERIDLYQFHEPDEEGTPVEDSWAVMEQLKQEGKVRSSGVSNFGIPLLERCESQHHIDSVQPQFSLINRDTASDIIPWVAHHGTGIIAYSPLGSGLLTGKFTASRVKSFPADDWRSKYSPDFREPALSRNLRLRDLLLPVAANRGTTVEAIALA